MKTIKISQNTKEKLMVFGDGLSLNKTMRKLLESAEEENDAIKIDNTKTTNIGIDDDLLVKLKKCKKYSNESHSATIERLLDEYVKQ